MKTAKILLAIILLVLSYQTVNARIINVPADCPTIQAGIDSANSGDTVLVDRGTYYENINFKGGNILVASNYIFDRLRATVDSTIINGGGLGRVVKMQSVNGVNAGIVGFTITNGRADNGGGGIYCYLTSARISHNVITGDTAGSGYGGGIYVGWKSSPRIDSNQILNNLATLGGGVKYSDSSFGEIYGNIIRKNRAWPDNGGGLHISGGSFPNIHNNIIDSNTARYYGGGIDCAGGSSPNITENDIVANDGPAGGGGIGCGLSSPTIERNTISKNTSRDCGGGILVRSSHATIRFNLIVRNESPSYAGGVEFFEDTSSFVNNTVVENSASGYNAGGGLYCAQYSAPEIRNNIITNSDTGYGISCSPTSNPHISYNDVWDNHDGNFCGCPPGVGDTSCRENCNGTPCDSFYNIIEDPLFDPASNYALLCTSVCIDAGDSTDSVPCGGGRFIDMGWIEFCYLGDCNGDCVVDLGDVLYLISYLYKGGPAPDPLEAGDVDCSGGIDLGDVLYLIAYLYKNGPAPCANCDGKLTTSMRSGSELHKDKEPAQIGFSSPTISKDGIFEVPVVCKSGVDVAGVQLEMKYDPEKITLLEPALTSRTEGLQIYSSAKDGIGKIGILDLTGEGYISGGTGALVTLRGKGSDLSNLEITEAILLDRDTHKIPVQIVPEMKKSEGDFVAGESTIPQEFSLSQNYPNPFNPDTKICYTLPEGCHVKLSIYNLKGQRLKVLVDRFGAAGRKTVTWDGTNESGAQVASGVYFYKLEAGAFCSTKKMVLIR